VVTRKDVEVNVFGTLARRPLSWLEYPQVKRCVQGTAIAGDECAVGHFGVTVVWLPLESVSSEIARTRA
jgi:hypothetical protein